MSKKVNRKKIKTPEMMEELFDNYREFNTTQFQEKKVYNQKLDKTSSMKLKRPLTWEGFSVFLKKQNIASDILKYRHNRDNMYPEFKDIIREIDAEIFDENYSGAANNIYNPSIVARKLKLADHKAQEGQPTIMVIDMRKHDEDD